MVKVTGLDKHIRRTKALTSAKTMRNLGRATYVAADAQRVEARRLIADDAIQGAGHVPSAPGEPPNWDTGQLANEIVARQTGPLSSESEAYAPYAEDLEFGTSKMAERPFMKPASSNTKDVLKQNVIAVVKKALREV